MRWLKGGQPYTTHLTFGRIHMVEVCQPILRDCGQTWTAVEKLPFLQLIYSIMEDRTKSKLSIWTFSIIDCVPAVANVKERSRKTAVPWRNNVNS